MRMHSAKPNGWSWVAAICVSALLVAAMGLALAPGSARAQTFSPVVDASLSDTTSSSEGPVNADITTTFNVPAADMIYGSFFSLTPEAFFPTDRTVDPAIGTKVGSIDATATLGLLNGACSNSLPVGLNLLWASIDTSDTLADFSAQFADVNPADTIPDGAQHYPEFVTRIIPGVEPLERHFGKASVSGTNVSINIVYFPPGSLGFPEDSGVVSVLLLNDIGDPGAVPAPSPITDFCAPLNSEVVTQGLAGDGAEVRRNPDCEDTFSFRWSAESMLNADGDGYESYNDTCPLTTNIDPSFKTPLGDPDGDGIDGACEPAGGVGALCWPGYPGSFNDCDGDSFVNRGDNCPLVDNGNQADGDADDIGDACDPNPGTPDGSTIVAQAPALQVDIDIEGGTACSEVGAETPTPTATPTSTAAAATGTATVIATATPEGTATATTVAGEGCAPVIPGTYNGLVRLDGAPAAAGYEVTAVIDGVDWGSAIVSGGRYALDVPQKLPAAEPCFAGGTITFEINGATCEPTEDWASGLHDVDLSCAAAPPPTVVPPTVPPGTPTVPATPVVTPAKPPTTGGGGLGGPADGLPLWALALAGWAALTAVAGFGTMAARMRKP